MASKGTSKFVMQRATAVLLVPLLAWFLISLIGQVGSSQAEMKSWLASPLNAILMSAFIVIGAMHMRIGMSEIIEDYIHSGLRSVLMTINWLAALGVIALTLWSVLTLAFT